MLAVKIIFVILYFIAVEKFYKNAHEILGIGRAEAYIPVLNAYYLYQYYWEKEMGIWFYLMFIPGLVLVPFHGIAHIVGIVFMALAGINVFFLVFNICKKSKEKEDL